MANELDNIEIMLELAQHDDENIISFKKELKDLRDRFEVGSGDSKLKLEDLSMRIEQYVKKGQMLEKKDVDVPVIEAAKEDKKITKDDTTVINMLEKLKSVKSEPEKKMEN